MHDPLSRQFLSPDLAVPFAINQVRASIRGKVGNVGLREMTFATNGYQYGNLNPVTWSDPSGNSPGMDPFNGEGLANTYARQKMRSEGFPNAPASRSELGNQLVSKALEGTTFAETATGAFLIGSALPGRKNGGKSGTASKVGNLSQLGLDKTGTKEVQRTKSLIENRGNSQYQKDYTIFGNNPSKKTGKVGLPVKQFGTYQEFTVTTPGLKGRGERRLVTDSETGGMFFSPDHYENFIQIK